MDAGLLGIIFDQPTCVKDFMTQHIARRLSPLLFSSDVHEIFFQTRPSAATSETIITASDFIAEIVYTVTVKSGKNHRFRPLFKRTLDSHPRQPIDVMLVLTLSGALNLFIKLIFNHS